MDDANGGSDGVNNSCAKLSKLNLEAKFDGIGEGGGIFKKPLRAHQLQGGGSGQQQQPQQLQQLPKLEPNGGNGWQEKAPMPSLPEKKRVCILGAGVAVAGGNDLTMDSTSLEVNHLFAPAVALASTTPVTKDHVPTFCVESNANNHGDGGHNRWHGRLPLELFHGQLDSGSYKEDGGGGNEVVRY